MEAPRAEGAPHDGVGIGSDPFLQAMRRRGKVQLRIAEVYAAYREARPELAGTEDFYKRVLSALESLDAEGLVSLPDRSAWDRTVNPRTPKTVSLGQRKTKTVREAVAWVPLLAFAADVRHPGTLADLAAVNAWLVHRGDARRPSVPTQERSLEIFGNEKRLDALRSGETLFNGRLGLAALDCRIVDPALSFECAGDARGRPVLVVENLASYDSFCRHNADPASGHPFAAIAWGAGNAFQKSWSRLEEVACRAGTKEIHYLGDIDPDGLEILSSAAQQAAQRDLVLTPHLPFYEWLLANGRRLPSERQIVRAADLPEKLFPISLAEQIANLFRMGLRIPQEALGLEALTVPAAGRRTTTSPDTTPATSVSNEAASLDGVSIEPGLCAGPTSAP